MAKQKRRSLSEAADEVRQSAEPARVEVEPDPEPVEEDAGPKTSGRRRVGAEKTRLNVNVPTDLYDRFQEMASRSGAPMSFLVIQYIQAALDAEDPLPWR